MPADVPREFSADCPCVGHCSTALGDDVCRGCGRTFEEVTRWPEMTEDERRAVNRRIALARGEQSILMNQPAQTRN